MPLRSSSSSCRYVAAATAAPPLAPSPSVQPQLSLSSSAVEGGPSLRATAFNPASLAASASSAATAPRRRCCYCRSRAMLCPPSTRRLRPAPSDSLSLFFIFKKNLSSKICFSLAFCRSGAMTMLSRRCSPPFGFGHCCSLAVVVSTSSSCSPLRLRRRGYDLNGGKELRSSSYRPEVMV